MNLDMISLFLQYNYYLSINLSSPQKGKVIKIGILKINFVYDVI